ncbi:MAG: hypothetical protein RAK17_01410 [Caldisphaera sp.]|nr:hypothetical protein [Caldisphaera sp.]
MSYIDNASMEISDEDKRWASSLIDQCIKNYGVNGNHNSLYYMPSCLNYIKDLVTKNINKENIIKFLVNTKKLSMQLFNELISKYNVELLLPTNVDPKKDIEIYVWPSLLSDNSKEFYSLTLYTWFSFSFKPGDGKSELEPITFLFYKEKNDFLLLTAYARVHYDLCEYDLIKRKDLKILFANFGHTPNITDINYVRVNCPKIKSNSKKTGRNYWDRIWLSACNIFARIIGVNRIPLKTASKIIKISFLGCLPKTANNPFKSPIYPLQFF